MGTDTSAVPGTIPASSCDRCGLLTSPPERFGCEACGALPTKHHLVELDTAGAVTSFATVWRHAKPTPPTPFTVLHVLLDAGPALKGVLEDGLPTPSIGERVRGRVEQTSGGPLLRWEPTGGEG